MLRINDDKIQLICYATDGISYKYDSDLKKYCLESPFKFIPYELAFNEEEIITLIKIISNKKPRLKITIELEDEEEI